LPGNACAPAATFTLNNISVVTSSTAITAFSFPISTTCAGPITLQPQLSSGFTTGGTFSANNGLGINPQNGTVPLSTAAAGTYVVQYQYPNQTCVTGGTSTDTLTIIAPDTAKVGLSYTPIVCFGSTQVLLPQFQSGRTFGGTFGGATASALNPTTGAISVANLSPGSYTLSYSVADSTCRIGKIGQTGLQVVDTAVALDYAYGVLCSNLSSAAVQKGVGFTEGGFFRVTGLDIDSISGTLSFGRADTGVFDVRYVFAGNACQRSASENVSVEVINCDSTLREIFVPSAFSPNEDGSNDLLRVRGSIKTMKFQVFDRWGERVFFTEKQSLSWDGTYGGKPLDPAVFVYTLSATDILGANYDLKGTITLIR
jgi:gliding motility-associated-like protein